MMATAMNKRQRHADALPLLERAALPLDAVRQLEAMEIPAPRTPKNRTITATSRDIYDIRPLK